MLGKYIPAIVMLIAGVIISVINIVNKVEKVAGLKRLFLVLLVFYIIGLISKAVINKALKDRRTDKEKKTNE